MCEPYFNYFTVDGMSISVNLNLVCAFHPDKTDKTKTMIVFTNGGELVIDQPYSSIFEPESNLNG